MCNKIVFIIFLKIHIKINFKKKPLFCAIKINPNTLAVLARWKIIQQYILKNQEATAKSDIIDEKYNLIIIKL